MVPGKKITIGLSLFLLLNAEPTVAQVIITKPDTTVTANIPEENLKIKPEKQRQRNKTEKKVFISCLFIVLTTLLLYNVRSK